MPVGFPTPCTTPPPSPTAPPSPGMPDTVTATVDNDDASSDSAKPNGDDACGSGTKDLRRCPHNARESVPVAATHTADRTDSDSSSGNGGRARSADAGVVAAEERASGRCRGGDSTAGVTGSRNRAEQRVLATTAAPEKQQRPESAATAVAVARKVERVSALEQAAQGGDVVLFRCRGLLSRLQRWVLRSEWDHVGVVSTFGSWFSRATIRLRLLVFFRRVACSACVFFVLFLAMVEFVRQFVYVLSLAATCNF